MYLPVCARLRYLGHILKPKPYFGFTTTFFAPLLSILLGVGLSPSPVPAPCQPKRTPPSTGLLQKYSQPSFLQELQIPSEKLLRSSRIEQPFIDKSLGPLNDLQIVFSFYCFLQFNSLDFKLLWLMINSRSIALLFSSSLVSLAHFFFMFLLKKDPGKQIAD